MVKHVSNDIDIIFEKRKKLETIFSTYLQNAYCTAFDQHDLMSLVNEGLSVIYLYGDEFTIPHDRANINYVGILKRPRVWCAANSRSELARKNIFVSNAVLCLSYRGFVSDILKGKPVWNIGNIKEPLEEIKEEAVQRLCEISCESVRYLEIDSPGMFGVAFTEESFVLMIEGNARQFFYDEIEKVGTWKNSGKTSLQLNFYDGTIYKADAFSAQMNLPFRDMVTLLRAFVDIAKDGMSEPE